MTFSLFWVTESPEDTGKCDFDVQNIPCISQFQHTKLQLLLTMLENNIISSMLTRTSSGGSLTRTSSGGSLTRSPSGRGRRASMPRRRQSQDGGKKQVSFNPRAQYHTVPYPSDTEKNNIWYTSNEYSAARERELFIRKKISENDALFRKNEENLIAQGILTYQGVMSKIQSVDNSIIAVLEEQDAQEVKFHLSQNKLKKSKIRSKRGDDTFAVNDEKIAKVYRSHSKKSLKHAQDRALRHEKHLKQLGSATVSSLSPGRVSPGRTSPGRTSPGRASKRRTARRVPKNEREPLEIIKTENPLVIRSRRQMLALNAIEALPLSKRFSNPAA